MTRSEEIDKIASAFAIDEVKDTCNPASKRGLLYVGFITGAEWADTHPDIDVRTMAAWQSGYKEAIEKACEWLSVELDKEEELHYIHLHGFDKERRGIFLEELKKAMKGD